MHESKSPAPDPLPTLHEALAAAEELAARYRRAIAVIEAPHQAAPLGEAEAKQSRKLFVPSGPNGVTQIASAQRVLRDAGRALAVSEIVTHMIASDFPHADVKKLRGSLTRTLDRNVDKGKLRKAGPGRYAMP